MNILFEDNQIIVVEKPPGVLSQADGSPYPDMINELKKYLKEKYSKPGNVFVGLVHRLDRNVGGVMVFAKTSKAASRLSKQVRDREFKKTYLAVCIDSGLMIHDSRKIVKLKDYLLKDEKTNTVKVVSESTPDAKEAILNFKILAKKRSGKNLLNLLEVELETGRTHQVRVQLANVGLPIVGDMKYGKKLDPSTPLPKGTSRMTNQQPNKYEDLALWAYKLSFKHPVSNKVLNFTILPPDSEPWELFEI